MPSSPDLQYALNARRLAQKPDLDFDTIKKFTINVQIDLVKANVKQAYRGDALKASVRKYGFRVRSVDEQLWTRVVELASRLFRMAKHYKGGKTDLILLIAARWMVPTGTDWASYAEIDTLRKASSAFANSITVDVYVLWLGGYVHFVDFNLESVDRAERFIRKKLGAGMGVHSEIIRYKHPVIQIPVPRWQRNAFVPPKHLASELGVDAIIKTGTRLAEPLYDDLDYEAATAFYLKDWGEKIREWIPR